MLSEHLRSEIKKKRRALRNRPLPAVPTEHQPGTTAKVDVMAVRESAGEDLFHPDDAIMDRSKLEEEEE